MSSDLFSKVLLGHCGHIKPADKNRARVRIIFQHLLTTKIGKIHFNLFSLHLVKDIINFSHALFFCEIGFRETN